VRKRDEPRKATTEPVGEGLLASSDRRRAGGRTDGREPSLLRRARWTVLVAAGLVLGPGAAVTGGGVDHVTSLPLAASGLLVIGWLAVAVGLVGGVGVAVPQASRVLAGVLVVSWIVVEASLHSREAATG
jgi:hypothetical protein